MVKTICKRRAWVAESNFDWGKKKKIRIIKILENQNNPFHGIHGDKGERWQIPLQVDKRKGYDDHSLKMASIELRNEKWTWKDKLSVATFWQPTEKKAQQVFWSKEDQ